MLCSSSLGHAKYFKETFIVLLRIREGRPTLDYFESFLHTKNARHLKFFIFIFLHFLSIFFHLCFLISKIQNSRKLGRFAKICIYAKYWVFVIHENKYMWKLISWKIIQAKFIHIRYVHKFTLTSISQSAFLHGQTVTWLAACMYSQGNWICIYKIHIMINRKKPVHLP